MCGIFATFGVSDSKTIIYNNLKDLEYRGYDSWGVAVLSKSGMIKIAKSTGFLKSKPPRLPDSDMGIGHTRWATHGGVTKSNAHPHLSCGHRLAIVHNGIVENYLELKSQLKNTHSLSSQTDTEILVHYLEELVEDHHLFLQDAVKKLVQLITGLNAFVVLDRDSKDIVAYRHGSPLTLGKKGHELYLSSDLPTLSSIVSHISPLKDGQIISLKHLSKSISWTPVSQNIRISTQIKTKYHMESEIGEIKEFTKNQDHFKESILTACRKTISRSSHIILTGCGSSYNACLYGQYLLNSVGCSAQACVASNATHFLPLMKSSTLIIALSQSGETIDTVELVKYAKAKGVKTLCFTNVPHSTLDQICDYSLHLNIGVEVAVASTKAFVAMIMAFSSILSQTKNQDNLTSLNKLFDSDNIDQLVLLARKLMRLKHLLVLGNGNYYPIALEAALKFKEIGYLHAEAILTGELKHGPLALITPKTTCLLLGKKSDLGIVAKEIQARGGDVVIVGAVDDSFSSVLYTTVFCYLLSYHHAVFLNHNPDRPRNLAKSVTVK